jgi:hypothetical protein
MMVWIVRAMMSVPPPGPAVATNSIGFVGCHAANDGLAIARTAAPAKISAAQL